MKGQTDTLTFAPEDFIKRDEGITALRLIIDSITIAFACEDSEDRPSKGLRTRRIDFSRHFLDTTRARQKRNKLQFGRTSLYL